eukprot:CAMPEP_0119103610 /NCGR_PEP_ID=MMETSP1180-20130426/2015_1 /TAXON_ID=3052 ORGANISM="Chlamydomonas cf sp, Strain CCMP681" /NCGR_SAMPLE_ID=MMETSP1180 /ASSEMBLY_ACC=CAM_ASM_000741 /LENGTH=484 /DNA_ID=CAMNT_0007088163 /DNA_START=14 /DNA_END=1468 /DNA_ORIENTATION=+
MHSAAARCATHTARSDVVAGVVTAHAPSPAHRHTADVENVVVVGSGPAGYTAAIYAGRANLKPVVFEGFLNGQGGQLMGTTEVENFPGFPEGVTGPDLMDRMRKQAERWGAEIYTEDVESIDFSSRPFTVRTSEREVKAHSLILATGATARRLGFPTEQAFWSKGISACAICDGASPLFKDRPVAVVGGGDSAAEEAVYLTKYASRVHLLVRGERLRASKAMADRAVSNPRITVHYNTTVLAAAGEAVLAALELQDTKTGTTRQLDVAGLFYGIGHQPNTKLFSEHVELDALGYVRVQHGVETSLAGVFAAGDLHDSEWRQAITAAGAGCMAALSVERYLTMNNLGVEFKQSSPEESPAEELPTSHTPSEDTEELFDMMQDKHRGQFALRKLYHESDRLIAVLYSAPSCGPCRTLKPIFNAVVDEYRGRIHYVEVDIEQDPEVAEAAGVTGTPTVQFFKGKDMITLLPGVRQKREYRELLTAHI